VRELENVIERAIILSKGPSLRIVDQFNTSLKTSKMSDSDLKALADLEREHILLVLQKTNWRVEGTKGARLVRISFVAWTSSMSQGFL